MEEEKDKSNNFVGMHGEVVKVSLRTWGWGLWRGTVRPSSRSRATP